MGRKEPEVGVGRKEEPAVPEEVGRGGTTGFMLLLTEGTEDAVAAAAAAAAAV